MAELHKLGIEVAKSTVENYKPRGERLPSVTWRTFLDQHLKELVAIDFFVVPTATFKVLFVPWRTHQSLDQDAPNGRWVRLAEPGQVIEFPVVQGLHHYYLPKAA